MKIKLLAAGLVLALSSGYTLTAAAQAKPETLVKQRQAVMTLQGKYFGPLVAMAQGKVPYNAGVVARNLTYLDQLTKMAWDGFDPSTSGAQSRALPEIYKDPAKFKAAQDALHAEIAKLDAAVKSGNEAAVKAAIGATGKTCGSCHDAFRSK